MALCSGPQNTVGTIETVLGVHQNGRSWVSTSKMGEPLASAHTAKILSWDEFRTFCISWHGGLIQAGGLVGVGMGGASDGGREDEIGYCLMLFTLPGVAYQKTVVRDMVEKVCRYLGSEVAREKVSVSR